ncbi:Vacuolar calcium ion transporter [Madurella mycetomatis]|uniref:Vacuolar calcium ion transporter n=1 Tax=Madurella mycetomatis TaxID=100816 RepID=A0A175WJV2_9PEZI|nr:Vacuolar calcium ion transporter [Madurella mycetomatis]
MKEASPNPQYFDRVRSWARTKAHGVTHRSSRHSDSISLPVASPRAFKTAQSSGTFADRAGHASPTPPALPNAGHGDPASSGGEPSAQAASGTDPPDGSSSSSPITPSPQAAEPGLVVEPGAGQHEKNIARRLLRTVKAVLLHTKLNLLLVFVPIGIAVNEIPGMSPGIIFVMNAIAIVPLAGLLSFATEAVARRLGDSLGALLNVTFGNAVELIIFIALVKNEIRIVQASLLGSILANLLLILGMSFFLGGMRFREQIYNSTVTQMSACLLSLSVVSLVLPTAFHASFSDLKLADAQSLKISRGTSVVLLLVYIVYLLFQLLSHSYMYESTPQHIIDEEAAPGPVANWLDSSSSEDSSSSDSDSTDSEYSRGTISKRVRRVMRRHRKMSVASEVGDGSQTSFFGTSDANIRYRRNAHPSPALLPQNLATERSAIIGGPANTANRTTSRTGLNPGKPLKSKRSMRMWRPAQKPSPPLMNREDLYFTLFETVCLFVSTFITNFLVLDGRSNYLEGALLLATYIIISVVAFFYPSHADTSSWGA